MLPTLTLPIKVLCGAVYFDFFCSKICYRRRTLCKSKQDKNTVPVENEVQVPALVVYFTVKICFLLTFMDALVITQLVS